MKKILMIEDNKSVADSVIAALELRGHEVTLAMTGDAGFHAAHEGIFDVILCDFELPEQAGEVARGIGTRLLDSIPRKGALTILWSGLSRDKDVAAMETPPDHALTKENMVGVLELIEGPDAA